MQNDPHPHIPQGRSVVQGLTNSGPDGPRRMALWVDKQGTEVTILSLGTGDTDAEALADLYEDIAIHWPRSQWPDGVAGTPRGSH